MLRKKKSEAICALKLLKGGMLAAEQRMCHFLSSFHLPEMNKTCINGFLWSLYFKKKTRVLSYEISPHFDMENYSHYRKLINNNRNTDKKYIITNFQWK